MKVKTIFLDRRKEKSIIKKNKLNRLNKIKAKKKELGRRLLPDEIKELLTNTQIIIEE